MTGWKRFSALLLSLVFSLQAWGQAGPSPLQEGKLILSRLRSELTTLKDSLQTAREEAEKSSRTARDLEARLTAQSEALTEALQESTLLRDSLMNLRPSWRDWLTWGGIGFLVGAGTGLFLGIQITR